MWEDKSANIIGSGKKKLLKTKQETTASTPTTALCTKLNLVKTPYNVKLNCCHKYDTTHLLFQNTFNGNTLIRWGVVKIVSNVQHHLILSKILNTVQILLKFPEPNPQCALHPHHTAYPLHQDPSWTAAMLKQSPWQKCCRGLWKAQPSAVSDSRGCLLLSSLLIFWCYVFLHFLIVFSFSNINSWECRLWWSPHAKSIH